MNYNTKKGILTYIFDLIIDAIKWFSSAGFIMWGWNTLAPHINCPLFTYWEIFSMRMMLSCFMVIIWQKNK